MSLQKNKKLCWEELRRVVSDARKIHSSLINSMPFHFIIVKPNLSDTNQFIRLLSLGTLPGQTDRTLLYADIKCSSSYQPGSSLEWKAAFESNQMTNSSKKAYSKEEELLRERKRLSASGITDVELDIHEKNLIFPAAGSLYTMAVSDIGMTSNNGPIEIISNCSGPRMDPKVSPTDSNLVAFVTDGDVWVTDLNTNEEKRITNYYLRDESGSDIVTAGVASYICQEEFDRYTGYWWQPVSTSDKKRILFEVVDNRNVEEIKISNYLQNSLDSYRYPRAGGLNSTVDIRIAEFDSFSTNQEPTSLVYKMSTPLKSIVPWMEYIVRVGWVPSGQGVWVWVLDRSQTHSAIVYLRLNMFDVIDYRNGQKVCDDVITSIIHDFKILYEETNTVWVNVHDVIHFLKTENDEEISFLFASEKTGFRHLYLIETKPFEDEVGSSCMKQLTFGDWEVSSQPDDFWVDEKSKMIYFMATKDTPLESNLYCKSYKEEDEVKRITSPGNNHTVSMSSDFKHLVILSTNLAEVSCIRLCSLQKDHDLSTVIELPSPLEVSSFYFPPKLFSFENSSGDQIHGLLHTPPNMQPGVKYPTMLYIYGGPHVQLVSNSFKAFKNYRLYTLASMGYIVVVIDGRGSAKRGLKFESVLKNKMGQVEISDQVEGLQYLDRTFGCIDMKRIAIHGWSYGHFNFYLFILITLFLQGDTYL